MIWSIIAFITISLCYLLYECLCKKDILKDLVDISPAILLLIFNKPMAAWFLMFCLIANEFIYDNWIIGGLSFAVGYVLATLFATHFIFNWINFLICIGTIIAVAIPIFILYKGKIIVKLGAIGYGLISIAPCLYAFSLTYNPGFLGLAIGDILLGIYGVTDNKWVRIVSDLFYFAGTCFVPLALI